MEDPQYTLLPEQPLPTPKVRNLVLIALPPNETFHKPPPPAAFVASLKQIGLIHPISVIEPQNGTGMYLVAVGRSRIMAARHLGWKTIRAQVYPAGTDTVEIMTIVENQQRAENPFGDVAAIEALVKKGATYRDIQIATGMSVAKIQKRMKLHHLLPELRQRLADGQLAVSTAERIVKELPSPAQQQEFLQTIDDRKITRKELTTFRQVHTQAFFDQLPDALFQAPDDDRETTEDPKNVLTLTVSYAMNEQEYRKVQDFLHTTAQTTIEVELRAAVQEELRKWQSCIQEQHHAGSDDGTNSGD